jgi:RING finger/CHY zinc finger protein 1
MLKHTIQAMDIEIALTPMPEEYRKKRVRIRCNDCREESSTPFHILRLKCRGTCGSYNTVKIGEASDSEEEELTIEDMIRDLMESLGEE